MISLLSEEGVDIERRFRSSMERLGISELENSVKGVRGLINEKNIAEPSRKGF